MSGLAWIPGEPPTCACPSSPSPASEALLNKACWLPRLRRGKFRTSSVLRRPTGYTSKPAGGYSIYQVTTSSKLAICTTLCKHTTCSAIPFKTFQEGVVARKTHGIERPYYLARFRRFPVSASSFRKVKLCDSLIRVFHDWRKREGFVVSRETPQEQGVKTHSQHNHYLPRTTIHHVRDLSKGSTRGHLAERESRTEAPTRRSSMSVKQDRRGSQQGRSSVRQGERGRQYQGGTGKCSAGREMAFERELAGARN